MKDHIFDLNGFVYCCDVEVTSGGCVIDNLMLLDSNDEDLNRPVRDMATIMLCKHELDKEFDWQIEEQKELDLMHEEADHAEVRWEAKMDR